MLWIYLRMHASAKIGRFLDLVFWRHRDVNSDPKVDEAYDWARAFKPNPAATKDPGYDWVAIYGKECFDRDFAIYRSLDEKADAILKYIAAGTGLFSALGVAAIKAGVPWILASATPSFLFAMVAVFYAIRARQPGSVMYPPTAQRALELIEEESETAKARFAAYWHFLQVAQLIANEDRARHVNRATQAMGMFVLLLSLPFAAAVFAAFFPVTAGG